MDLEDAVAILKDEVRSKCSAYADRALAEVLPLVEEKFTSTNKPIEDEHNTQQSHGDICEWITKEYSWGEGYSTSLWSQTVTMSCPVHCEGVPCRDTAIREKCGPEPCTMYVQP